MVKEEVDGPFIYSNCVDRLMACAAYITLDALITTNIGDSMKFVQWSRAPREARGTALGGPRCGRHRVWCVRPLPSQGTPTIHLRVVSNQSRINRCGQNFYIIHIWPSECKKLADIRYERIREKRKSSLRTRHQSKWKCSINNRLSDGEIRSKGNIGRGCTWLRIKHRLMKVHKSFYLKLSVRSCLDIASICATKPIYPSFFWLWQCYFTTLLFNKVD